ARCFRSIRYARYTSAISVHSEGMMPACAHSAQSLRSLSPQRSARQASNLSYRTWGISMAQTVIGVFDSDPAAEQAVQNLLAVGVDSEGIHIHTQPSEIGAMTHP